MGKKKLIIIIASLVAVLGIGAVVLFVVLKDKGYRLLKVYEVEGDASVTREGIGKIDPYNNMVLESGDVISLVTGKMCLKADDDKYIYLEEGTELVLNASGDSENSKTVIELRSGAITNDIQNKLSEDSVYDVHTPNSTMSVRGTMFRVAVYEINGVKYTKVTTFEGTVVTRLVYKDGTVAEEEVAIEKGKEVIIYEDGTTTDYVSEPRDIDFSEIPDSVLGIVRDAQNDGRDVALLEGDAVVTFTYKGAVFATQYVQKGEKAVRPSLQPAETGDWKYDFDQPVTEDLTIEWE